jgi:hypothetical protein
LADPYLRSRGDLHAVLDPPLGADDAAKPDTMSGAHRPPVAGRRGERE